LRPGGGSSGQKGVASTIQQLGTPNFARLRLGIGRPPGRMDPAAYVLQDFNQSEKELVEFVLNQAVKAALVFIESGLEAAMNQFNGTLKEDNSLA
jgi:PTH1 family peptidyl-tRNA hydrolase